MLFVLLTTYLLYTVYKYCYETYIFYVGIYTKTLCTCLCDVYRCMYDMWYYSIYLRIDVNMKLFSGIFFSAWFSVWMLPVPYILCICMWIYFIFCVTHVFFIVIYFKKYTFCIYMYGISLFYIWCAVRFEVAYMYGIILL